MLISTPRRPSLSREQMTAGYLPGFTGEVKSGDIWVGVGCRQEEENTSPDRRLRLGCKISTALEFWGAKDNRPS